MGHSVILMIPPDFLVVQPEINRALALFKLTKFKEIEPKAGCRRFRLT